jgi:hypothetical protein
MTATCMVSARELWWQEPGVCTCSSPDDGCPNDWCPVDEGGWPMLLGALIDGTSYITDRQVLLPVERLAALPVGYGNLLTKLPRQAEDGLAEWLRATVLPGPSDVLFARGLVDLLEAAGFLLRPLEGVRRTHGICDPDLRLVGLAAPFWTADLDEDATRKAAL